jgi:uncharacterized phage-associated protein
MVSNAPLDITVFDVANWFLAKAKSEDVPLKHMKLQKLVYFAYGWHCAYSPVPLFQEAIYAWRHGPVVKDLYEHHKPCGDAPIIAENLVCKDLPKDVVESLEAVWKNYSPLPDATLGRAIRHHDSWRKAVRSMDWDAVIPLEVIREYFKELVEKYAKIAERHEHADHR